MKRIVFSILVIGCGLLEAQPCGSLDDLTAQLDSLTYYLDSLHKNLEDRWLYSKKIRLEGIEDVLKRLENLESVLLWESPFKYETIKEFKQEIKTTRGTPVFIYHKFGDVIIYASDSDELKVDGVIELVSKSREIAKEYAKEINVKIEESVDKIKVITLSPVKSSPTVHYQINLKILLPKWSPVVVRNAFGDVKIEGIEERCSVNTRFGKIGLREIKGPIDVANKFGKIELTLAHKISCNISAMTTFGDIETDLPLKIERDRFILKALGVIEDGRIWIKLNGKNSDIYIRVLK